MVMAVSLRALFLQDGDRVIRGNAPLGVVSN